MKKLKEENSTQKLLDLIRSGELNQVNDTIPDDPNPSLPVTIKTKYLNLGVLISQRDLTLVLTSNKGFTKKKGLVKWDNIPLPENLQPETDEFSAFLGRCLDNFLGNKKKIPIWCALKSSSLKIKNITIPDIPQAKIANAAFWGLKKETDFNETREIFNFEILGDVSVDGIKKKKILVFSAPRDEIDSLKKTFRQAGYFLDGITSIPFAMQNFIRTGQIQINDPYFAIVNISRDTSEIHCFSQSGILLIRNLRAGSRNLIETLDTPRDMDPIDYLSSMTDTDTNKFSKIKDTSERLISKIVRTGDYCAHNYTDNTPLTRYIFYGETDQCDPFMKLASAMIRTRIDIFEPVRDDLSGSIEAQLPQNMKQRNSVLTAFGIALSDNDITPNFLFTFNDRQKIKKQKRITQATVLAGTILLMTCFSAHSWLNYTHKKDLAALAQLSRDQTEFGENKIQKEVISEAIALAEKNNSAKKKYIKSYLPLAVIYDICHFTPDYIYLSSMAYDLKKDTENQDRVSKKVLIEGQVSGQSNSLGSDLSNYILNLSESPVFGYIEITSKQIKLIDHKKNLFFKATLEVL